MRLGAFSVWVALQFLASSAGSAPTVTAEKTNLYQVLGSEGLEQISLMIEHGYDGLNRICSIAENRDVCNELLAMGNFDESQFSDASLPTITKRTLAQILQLFSESGSETLRERFLHLTMLGLDRVFPMFQVNIDVAAEAAELEKSAALQWTRPEWRGFGQVPAERLLGPTLAPDPARRFGVHYADRTGECGSWVLSALDPEPRSRLSYLPHNRFRAMMTYGSSGRVERVNAPEVFGDIVFFDIVGDYHAALFVGRAKGTGDAMVFTKNGRGMTTPMFMRLSDLRNFYQNHFNVREILYLRPLRPL